MMKWYGTLALVFSLFLLAGLVYAGANTDKVGFVLVPYTFAQEYSDNAPTYTSENKIGLFTDKSTYAYGEQVKVYGRVMDESINGVTITLVAPNGNIVAIQSEPLDSLNNFKSEFTLGSLAKYSGEYTIIVKANNLANQVSIYVYGEPSTHGQYYVKSKTHYQSTIFTNTEKIEITAGSAVPGCEENFTCYIPYNALIQPGDTITWYNVDSAAHTVTSGETSFGPDGTFDTGLLMIGEQFSHKFYQKGIYSYFCMVHPWMEGQVTVGDVDYYPDTLPFSMINEKFDAREMINKNQKLLTENKQLKEKISEGNSRISELLETIEKHLQHIKRLEEIIQRYTNN